MIDRERLQSAYETARAALLAERTSDGYWVGELSASALSTATAITALHLANSPRTDLIRGGLTWLMEHQNPDGGWGDTVKSVSNISTTMLGRAAFHIAGQAETYVDSLKRCESWLGERYGRTPAELAEAVRERYGKDRTFSVPILMMCALAGLVPWHEVPRLPFELACLPQSWYRFARMPVVSYALPALIAIGQVIHANRSKWNPIARFVRWLAKRPSLRVLERIQPSSGGYLEATPLTSFVVMSLCAAKAPAPRVVDLGVQFLVESARPDGSWPIDSNLSIWVTTLALNALAVGNDLDSLDRRPDLLQWLLDQQTKVRHPFTGAAPGAWGWSHLPGSVPDCDDTPGALLALRNLGHVGTEPVSGLNWILDLQNSDGGLPTFCRGWGKLPFDRSGCDLTAHALRSLAVWKYDLVASTVVQTLAETCFVETAKGRLPTIRAIEVATEYGFDYLRKQQRPDGSWLPLWFGNQHVPGDENPVYGTARVLAAYRDLGRADTEQCRRGVAFLVEAQNPDGGWGGAKGVSSSVEETAVAAEVLIGLSDPAAERGIEYLVQHVEAGTFANPSPIGFYFAKLWYFEKMYPLAFTVGALGRALRK